LQKNAAIETSGSATAEAKARADKMLIEANSAVKLADLKAKAKEIEHNTALQILQKKREKELSYLQEMTRLEIDLAKKKAEIEVNKLNAMVNTITRPALVQLASAGNEKKMKLLQSLGIQSTLITDGNSPINLFNTANGLIGPQESK